MKRMKEERPEERVYEIKDLSLITWKKELFDKVHQALTPAILRLVYRDRLKSDDSGAPSVNYELLQSVINSYVELGLEQEDPFRNNQNRQQQMAFQQQNTAAEESNLKVYKDLFESKFLEALEEFYKKESQNFLNENSVIEYMKFSEKRLDQEKKRVESFLHKSSMSLVMNACTKALVKTHLKIIHKEFRSLLEQDRTEDLKRMFKLSEMSDGLNEMRDLLKDYIHTKGIEKVNEIHSEIADDPKKYVESIGQIYQRHRKLVEECFGNNSEFRTALDKACESFINNNKVTQELGPNKSAELLARYCDMLLKKSQGSDRAKEDGEGVHVFDRIVSTI